YDPTIERYWRKELVVDDRPCRLELLLPSLGSATLPLPTADGRSTCAAVVLVYSIAWRFTFEALERYHERAVQVRLNAAGGAGEGAGTPLLVLIGTQCDRAAEREVPAEEGARLAREIGCAFFVETSAK
ncbi:hypothetical protein B0H17DRAFT_877418, partial [Mycena rosella]